MKINELIKQKDSHIAIIGYGKEGKAMHSLLKKIGANTITICDANTQIPQEEYIKYKLGEEYLEDLDQYDLIFKAPGISPYQEAFLGLEEKIHSGIDLFFDNYTGKVIGITGTKGKSTISTILAKSLEGAGYKVKLVGNIGNPVLDEIDILNSEDMYDYVVFEMSSFMLWNFHSKLYIGYINNIYDCHLDWHHGRGNYRKEKLAILQQAKHKVIPEEVQQIIKENNNYSVIGRKNYIVHKNGTFNFYNHFVISDDDICIPGEHNKQNILGILYILDCIYKDKCESNWVASRLARELGETLKSFSGLPHRIETIGTYHGITFIDDAIATTPDSTISAIKTFDDKIGTILLGGQDSGFSQEQYSNLVNIIYNSNIDNIVLFPDTGETIFGDLSSFPYDTVFTFGLKDKTIRAVKTQSMKSAIDFSYKFTAQGKICLLSTAAPSFSVWKNGFVQKGTEFQKYVKEYKNT